MSNNSASINTGGGAMSMTNSAVGQGNEVSNNQSIASTTSSESDISERDDLLEALQKLLTDLSKAEDIPPDDSKDLRYSTEEAIDAARAQPPKKTRVVDKLTSIQKTLESLKNSAGSAVALGSLTKKILVAAGTLL
ncbi:hypothetical protein [cf. Phormidesmis sp. LEGE 11477]|uniref:hypothetical protein n=1 Tax=cf. Phormidesmis sp. LEGE 11477 TaxID=1828680 RepID=UPI001882E912|nr:hypothetical protein [cf. Phormidesmis sp. LEGE 11477]MBE9063946.1 hypothetical protein [cf. Phormidesmis sp. LEGE 11477]